MMHLRAGAGQLCDSTEGVTRVLTRSRVGT